MQGSKPLWGMANALQTDFHIVFLMFSIPPPQTVRKLVFFNGFSGQLR
jgi:hypothetical protein